MRELAFFVAGAIYAGIVAIILLMTAAYPQRMSTRQEIRLTSLSSCAG